MKTYGIEKSLKDLLKSIKGIEEAYIFGSYAADKMDASSDIDVLAVGSHSVLELQRRVAKLQRETAREFNIVNLSEKEFTAKKKKKVPFIDNIIKNKKIKLV